MNLNKILIPVFALFVFAALSGKTYSQDVIIDDKEKKTDTETRVFDSEGYDQSGYNKEGYDRNGFDKEGYNKEGRDKSGNSKTVNKPTDPDKTDPSTGKTDSPQTPPVIDSKEKSTDATKDQQTGDSKEKKKKKHKKNKNKNKNKIKNPGDL